MTSSTGTSGAPGSGPHGRGLHGFASEGSNMGRAALAEMIGAFFLIYTGTATASAAASGKTIAGAPPNSLSVALAFGLVLAALVGALAPVSGAHLNPAVTLGLAVTRRFPWRYVPSYLAFQLIGAVLGALATWATLGSRGADVGSLGLTKPAEGTSDGRAFLVEALITFLLVFIIIAVATDERVAPAVASTSIGFALTAAVLIGGAITGGAVNPVRALGPEIVTGNFTSFWVYLLAPTLGGIVAAVLYDKVVRHGEAPTMDDGDQASTTATRSTSDGAAR